MDYSVILFTVTAHLYYLLFYLTNRTYSYYMLSYWNLVTLSGQFKNVALLISYRGFLLLCS